MSLSYETLEISVYPSAQLLLIRFSSLQSTTKVPRLPTNRFYASKNG